MFPSTASPLTSGSAAARTVAALPAHIQPTPSSSSSSLLAFTHVLSRLKTQKRTGWVRSGVAGPESIADHMYRMGVLAMLVPPEEGFDVGRAVQMALVHDIAEAVVGDIAPSDNVPKAEKQRLEAEAMDAFVKEYLHDSPEARCMEELWEEYEAQSTPTARLIKDLDRFEMCLQVLEYERSDNLDLSQFYTALEGVRHPAVRHWGECLLEERKAFLVQKTGEVESTEEQR